MKKLKTYIVTWIILGMLLPATVLAQKPNYTFKSIEQSDGLINGTVQAMFQDSFGYVWIGTQNGVQRYDGKSFMNYDSFENDPEGRGGSYVNNICEDAGGNIWITTRWGIARYDRNRDKFSRFDWKEKAPPKGESLNFSAIMQDQDDGNILWITSLHYGLVRLDTRNDSCTIFPIADNAHGVINWILPYPGQNNTLLLGNTALLSFDKKSGRFTKLYSLAQDNNFMNNQINDAIIDPADPDIIWMATGDFWGRGDLGGLIRYNLKTGEKKIITPDNSQGEMKDIHLLCLLADGPDKLWIGTRYHGILLYQKGKDIFYGYYHEEFDPGSFVSTNSVRSMLKDRSGTLWFGTWGDGISILSPSRQKFTWFRHVPGETNTVSGNFINSFAEDKDGRIWIATTGAGVCRFDPKDNSFEDFFPDFSAAGSKASEITYLFFDSHENLWIATHDDALYRYNPVTGQRIHYTKGDTEKHVSQNRVSCMAELKPGEILVSTYGGGLNIYSYTDDSFRHFLRDPQDSTSIPDNQVWLPFLGPDGKYYLSGNSTAGLICFDPETEKFSEVEQPRVMSTAIMPCKVSDNEIYINEIAAGVTRISFGDKFDIQTVLDAEGRKIRNVESVLADNDGHLWLGTDNGLVEFDLQTKIATSFGPDDGLQGYKFNRLAAFRSSTGAMYFGGVNGFNVFHPEIISLSDYQPPVVFNGLKLFQETVPIGEGSPLDENIVLADHLTFSYDQNDFALSFAALDYSNPQKIQYRYILENHDNEWIHAGSNNTASYTNMDPGKYTLKVLATNSDGVWNTEPKQIGITILPPWWQTWWAYVIYGLVLLAGIFIVDRIQRRRLLEKERTQAREKELEQAREIEKAYENLKATQKQLVHAEKMASLGELTAGIAHEIQNPLNFINNFSDINAELITELTAEMDKGGLAEARAIADTIALNEEKIGHHGRRADAIVKGMLQHSRSGNSEKVPVNLNSMADEYLRLAYHGMRAKDKSFNADFRTDLEEGLPPIMAIPQDLGRVILNLINNAFYAVAEKAKQNNPGYKPEVIVSTRNYPPLRGDTRGNPKEVKAGTGVEVRVKDNGNGIPDEIKDKIFQPFFTTKPAGEGTGLGLSLSYDIVTKGHGGTLRVESTLGEGTEFIITLAGSMKNTES